MAMQWIDPSTPMAQAPSQNPQWPPVEALSSRLRRSIASTGSLLLHRLRPPSPHSGEADGAHATDTSEAHADQCAHCGRLLVGKRRLGQAATRRYCCSGCQEPHDTIVAAGLSGYYDVLDQCKAKDGGRAPAAHDEGRWDVFAHVVSTLARCGYRPYPPRTEAQVDLLLFGQRAGWRRTALDAVCFGNTMLFAAAVYFGERVGIDPRLEVFLLRCRWR